MKASHVILALITVILWGFSFIAIEIALRSIGPDQLVVARFLPATFLFFALLTARKKIGSLTSISRKDWGTLFIAGLFGVLIYNLALNTGQTMIPASLAALVIGLNPAMIAIVASLWLHERPSWRNWVGIIISMCGIVLVILGRYGTPELRHHHLVGALITLAAPISWGMYNSAIRLTSARIGALRSTSFAIALGTIPSLFFLDTSLLKTTISASPDFYGSILFLAAGCTVLGFTFWAEVLKHVEASKAGMFIYLVPLIATAGSCFILKEPVDLPLIAGTAIVLGGVVFSTRQK